MKILALEFSSSQHSVAVVDADAAHGRQALGEAVETGTRSTHAFELIERALGEARVEREQVECVAVGVGPGSYTGIRAAIAVAQGWQLAREVRLLPVSSAACIAAQAGVEGLSGLVEVVIDAQRGELYAAAYEVGEAGARELEPLRLATLDEVRRIESAGRVIVGPEATKWFPGGRLVYPRAATLGRLAAGRNDFVAGERLEPIYLRPVRFVKAPPPRVLPPGA